MHCQPCKTKVFWGFFQTIWECAQAAKKPWQVPLDKTMADLGHIWKLSLNFFKFNFTTSIVIIRRKIVSLKDDYFILFYDR